MLPGKRLRMRCAAVLLLATFCCVVFAPVAAAHPDDEVLQQIYLTPERSGLTVQLDLTPGVSVAPQFTRAIDEDGDGRVSPDEIAAHVASVRSGLSAEIDGVPVDLASTENHYPPIELLAAGAGTVTLVWTAALPENAQHLVLTDHYEPGARTAVQTSVLIAPEPIALGPISRTDANRSISVVLNPSGTTGSNDPAATATDTTPSTGAAMLDALRRPLTTPWAFAILLGACVLLGALHALTPGHGKAMLAAYLVGGQGTPRQAVTLGVVITFTHTAAVLALGGAVLAAGDNVLPHAVVPMLTITAGAVVLVLGLRLARRRWTNIRQAGHHDHHHAHDHAHAPVSESTSLRSVATMGVSAGVIPCPEALSVLLLAIGLNRAALGMVMIVAFSVGLAAVLVGLGLLLVTATPRLSGLSSRRSGWLTTRIPLISAVIVATLGCAMTVAGVTGLVG